MKAFFKPIKALTDKIEGMSLEGPLSLNGVTGAAEGNLIASLTLMTRVKIVVAENEIRAGALVNDLRLYNKDVRYFPPKDLIFYQSDLNGSLLSRERLSCFKALLSGEDVLIVTTIDAFLEKRPAYGTILKNIIKIDLNSVIELEAFTKKLVHIGYRKAAEVNDPGEFAVRGGIVDIFPLTEENPVRIELFGDDVDSIKYFNISSQRSGEAISEIEIFPASELFLSPDEMERGREKISRDLDKRYKKLREEMKTEESARLKRTVGEFLEELGMFAQTANPASYLNYFYDELFSLADFLDKENTLIFLLDPARLVERSEEARAEFSESMEGRYNGGYILEGQKELLFDAGEIAEKLTGFRLIALSEIAKNQNVFVFDKSLEVNSRQIGSYHGSFSGLESDLLRLGKKDYATIILSASHTRAKRLAEDLLKDGINAFYTEDYDRVPLKKEVMVTYGNKAEGFEYTDMKFAVISESDIFGGIRKKKKRFQAYEGEKISAFSALNVGDYVVHEDFGIGVYQGIEHIEIDGVTRDYLNISYRDNANIYVGASNLNSLQKYAAANTEKKPKINRIGGKEWARTRERVKGAVGEMAKKLVELYSLRSRSEGYYYGPDTVWQREFEELFPYEETEDQIHAIEAVKADMQSNKIMDRLICGDVGFGKTEVAIRAAFKAVQEGKQVAVLVPTTILAEQHYNTFKERMQNYPVTVDLLCRFRTPQAQKETLKELKKGRVDIVIGTHRLLSKDVEFKDLGLLVIDEEQRFGVAHKERIKELRKNVDVLALTATPIPRTLHMSLVGIRDMSVLEEAPQDRQPIQTFIMEYAPEIVREAINRELKRGGQVYYVYNRVNDIENVVDKLREICPKANIDYAHGQMPERVLEDIMSDFINGSIDVLVSTTIIETGMDIPNVNTMIIQNADQMGLSQLYQLRGRVGRSNRTAYAFLMYSKDKLLKETAEKRLNAIREFTDLGSGFKIAMKDLEIRGAGNVLGAEQHGHMDAVGYDLYCKMLNTAVKEEKGERIMPDFTTSIDIGIDAFIPNEYIGNENIKLDMYKRIASVENDDDAADMVDELTDRFGKVPKSVLNLVEISKLRSRAHEVYIENLSTNLKENEIVFLIFPKAELNPEHIGDVLGEVGEKLSFRAAGRPAFVLKTEEEDNYLEKAEVVVNAMRRLLD
ncbi:MAG: transcription-repair coupling factor [Lachnospiraceae bacterium]|nr:transcription-repair coupling factor [Lachnospiraceae bacterium]